MATPLRSSAISIEAVVPFRCIVPSVLAVSRAAKPGASPQISWLFRLGFGS